MDTESDLAMVIYKICFAVSQVKISMMDVVLVLWWCEEARMEEINIIFCMYMVTVLQSMNLQ